MNNKLSSTPSPVDVYVGSRIRLRRTLLGMSQERLGTALGLTFQQVQKYERGANRVGASRLYDLARVLDVPIAFFFDGMPDEAAIAPVASMPAESFAEARGAFGGVPAPGQVEGGTIASPAANWHYCPGGKPSTLCGPITVSAIPPCADACWTLCVLWQRSEAHHSRRSTRSLRKAAILPARKSWRSLSSSYSVRTHCMNGMRPSASA